MVQNELHFAHQTISKFVFVMYSSYGLLMQKANYENSTEADQGCDVSMFPYNHPTNKVYANKLSKPTWFCCVIQVSVIS
jgi:hypothetical protein